MSTVSFSTPGTAGSSSTASATSSMTTSDWFIPSSTSDSPTGTQNPTANVPEAHKGVSQTVLEWVFAIAALGVLTILVFWRYSRLRRAGRPIGHLFSHGPPQRPPSPNAAPFHHSIRRSYGNHRLRQGAGSGAGPYSPPPGSPYAPGTTGPAMPQMPAHILLPSDSVTVIPPWVLTTIPTLPNPNSTSGPENANGRRSNRAARGADIDAQGRRAGGPDPDDHPDGDGSGDDKDMLPAYETNSGPPRYAELVLGRGRNASAGANPTHIQELGHGAHGEDLEMGDMRRSVSEAREGEEGDREGTSTHEASTLNLIPGTHHEHPGT
ncbi:hypothetical protein SISSUDRAFT_1120148 [Sistotremastrum suecicum HHB10207 ss-3]|uniref:Uncharacterized protein n=1 Tax=Sistotremastrum suecicum HHB10207 ss-3 TaxID=1314776 RepID=A0A166CQR7_9AGAM|nr:hypothetical protein SISSUDRAFT_1120148 [Sistotremastrum suecicum HHB10207 ss-3]